MDSAVEEVIGVFEFVLADQPSVGIKQFMAELTSTGFEAGEIRAFAIEAVASGFLRPATNATNGSSFVVNRKRLADFRQKLASCDAVATASQRRHANSGAYAHAFSSDSSATEMNGLRVIAHE